MGENGQDHCKCGGERFRSSAKRCCLAYTLQEALAYSNFNGAYLEHADCRSTMCNVKVSYRSDKSGGQRLDEEAMFENQMLVDIAKSFSGSRLKTARASDGTMILSGYLVRKGKRLPKI